MSQSKQKLLRALINETALDTIQTLRLYNPTPNQLKFHRCDCPERIALGGNRTGKTTTAAIEFAWAVTGTHPWIKYPKTNGRAIVVAKDGTQLGQVLYRKLFRAGLFKIIPDEVTHLYRTYEPWRDHERENLAKPSLPLIPQRMIADIAWENKAQDIPRVIKLKNGWEILFCSSLGNPPHGIDVDLVFFDEEIQDKSRETDWYAEMSARLVDRGGRFIWSATPQAATERLYELHERAIEERNAEFPVIREFVFTLADNPYLSEKDKALFIRKFENDPEEYRVRVLGEFLLVSYRVYQNFSMEVHGVDYFDVPREWMRVMVVDPGFAATAATFFAVPPDNHAWHDRVFVYDEMLINRCTSKMFAEQVRLKIGEQNIQEFLIDLHGSRKTESTGKTIAEQYSEELKALNIRSLGTGSNFIPIGSEGWTQPGELKAQIGQVRSWLWERAEGKPPKLAVLRGAVPNFVEQMTKYRNKKDKPDEPDPKKYSEFPDTLRYMVLRDPQYTPPSKARARQSPIQKFLREKRRKKKELQGSSILMG